MTRLSAAPMANAARQPMSTGSKRGVEQHDGAGRTERGTDPEAAVDDEVGPAAHARRDQLLDGGVDGRVLAADAGAGEEAEQREAPQVPGERRRRRRDQVDGERDEEQLLAAEPVGQPAEEDGAQHRAGQIGAAGEADVGAAELQHRALPERAGHRAGQRHLQPVEDPGDAERRHHQGVKPAPRQPVEPRRNVGLDDGSRAHRRGSMRLRNGHARSDAELTGRYRETLAGATSVPASQCCRPAATARPTSRGWRPGSAARPANGRRRSASASAWRPGRHG